MSSLLHDLLASKIAFRTRGAKVIPSHFLMLEDVREEVWATDKNQQSMND